MNELAFAPFDGCALRLLAETDAPGLFWLIDENRQRLREWLDWVDHTTCESDALAFVRLTRNEAERGTAYTFGVWLDEHLAGVASLRRVNRQHGTAAIGYWIGREFTGRGLARRSAACLTEFGFRRLELNRIEIRCALGNLSSQRVPQALGYVMEGTARAAERVGARLLDQYVYAKLRVEDRSP